MTNTENGWIRREVHRRCYRATCSVIKALVHRYPRRTRPGSPSAFTHVPNSWYWGKTIARYKTGGNQALRSDYTNQANGTCTPFLKPSVCAGWVEEMKARQSLHILIADEGLQADGAILSSAW